MDSKYQLLPLAEGASETKKCYHKTENVQQSLINDDSCLVQDTESVNRNTCRWTCTRFPCCISNHVKCNNNTSEELCVNNGDIPIITEQPKALLSLGNNVQASENSQVLKSVREKTTNDEVDDKVPENLRHKTTNDEVDDIVPENLRQKTTSGEVADKESENLRHKTINDEVDDIVPENLRQKTASGEVADKESENLRHKTINDEVDDIVPENLRQKTASGEVADKESENLRQETINDEVDDRVPENLRQKTTNDEVDDIVPENLRQNITNDEVDNKEVSKEKLDQDIVPENLKQKTASGEVADKESENLRQETINDEVDDRVPENLRQKTTNDEVDDIVPENLRQNITNDEVDNKEVSKEKLDQDIVPENLKQKTASGEVADKESENLRQETINDEVDDRVPENLRQKTTNDEVDDIVPENLRQNITNDEVDNKEVSKEKLDQEVITKQPKSLATVENNLQQIGNPQILDNQINNKTNNDEEVITKQSKLVSCPDDNVQVSVSEHNKVQGNFRQETISDYDTKISKERALKKYVYFWRGEDLYSQWHPSTFCAEGQTFSCAEQYMMYQKAVAFGDLDSARKIMATKNPRTMKSLGRKVNGFNCDMWVSWCLYIVKEGNIQKNSEFKKQLYDTYPKVLVEASPYDNIWGIGLEQDDFLAWDEQTWDGKNWLGYMITEVRDELMCKDGIIEQHQRKIYIEQLLSKEPNLRYKMPQESGNLVKAVPINVNAAGVCVTEALKSIESEATTRERSCDSSTENHVNINKNSINKEATVMYNIPDSLNKYETGDMLSALKQNERGNDQLGGNVQLGGCDQLDSKEKLGGNDKSRSNDHLSDNKIENNKHFCGNKKVMSSDQLCGTGNEGSSEYLGGNYKSLSCGQLCY